MRTLREELEARESADLAAMLEGPPEQADADLAAMWEQTLRGRDLELVLGTAVLWCSRQILAGAVARCVRLIEDPTRSWQGGVLRTVEEWSRGEVALEDVWDAAQAAKSHVQDAVDEAVVNAAEAAGDNVVDFDDEALSSAGRAVITVGELGGDSAVDRMLDILRRAIPQPTAAAFRAAHAARNP